MTPVANSYFSGCGLMDYGLQRGGVAVQESFELDPVCCDSLRANFTHAVTSCDISKKLVRDERPADVKVFTYPCTKYSPIGDIHGVRTGDDLYLHALRHMVISPPEVFVLENVPGMRKFPVVMEAMTGLPDYFVTTFCPISTQAWLPQRRDRLIIIGSRRPFAWREPEVNRLVTLADILEADPKIDYHASIAKRMGGEYRDRPIISDPRKDDVAPTCVAHYAKDRSTRLVRDERFPMNVRPYSVREFARLQGAPDDFTFCGSDNDAYRQIGNGVSVPVGEWIGRELCRYFS